VFSAKGAAFITAWGSVPGIRKCESASAESAIHSGAFSSIIGAMPHRSVKKSALFVGLRRREALNRAFSARSQCDGGPGAMPQAYMDGAFDAKQVRRAPLVVGSGRLIQSPDLATLSGGRRL